MVGNDFVPQIPGIEILEGGIDALLGVYRDIIDEYGCLAGLYRGTLRIRKKGFSQFFGRKWQN